MDVTSFVLYKRSRSRLISILLAGPKLLDLNLERRSSIASPTAMKSSTCRSSTAPATSMEIVAPKLSQDNEYEFDDLDVGEENVPWLFQEENESWLLQTPVHKMPSEGMNEMVAQGEADTDENHILDSTDEELSVTAMSNLLNVLEEDVPGLQKPLPKKPSEGMTQTAVQDEACTWRNSKLFKLFDAFSKSERHKLYPNVVSPPKDREPLLYDFFGYDYSFEDEVSKTTDGGASATPPRYNLRTRRSRTNTKN